MNIFLLLLKQCSYKIKYNKTGQNYHFWARFGTLTFWKTTQNNVKKVKYVLKVDLNFIKNIGKTNNRLVY